MYRGKSRFNVRVKPSSSVEKVEGSLEEGLTVWVKSPPVDGRANREVAKVLKAYLKKMGYRVSEIRLVSGAGSSNKVFEVLFSD